MQVHMALRQRGWSRRTRDMSCFLFTLFFGSRPGRTCGPILTMYTSYDVFLRKEVPFGGVDEIAPHLGGQIAPKTQFWGRE